MTNHSESIELLTTAIKGCEYLSNSKGQAEQILKLSVNIALNGTLAHLSLKAGHGKVRRVANHEMNSDIGIERLLLD